MPPLPWTRGTAAPEHHGAEVVVVMASRLELARRRDVPAFLVASLRLLAAFRRAGGGVGLALLAEPSRRTFWTISAWADHESLLAYHRSPLHTAVVERFRPRMAGSTFTTWTAPGSELPPSWHVARQRLADARTDATTTAPREGTR